MVDWACKIFSINQSINFNFWGLMNRRDGLEKQILSGKIYGTKAEEDNAQNTQTV